MKSHYYLLFLLLFETSCTSMKNENLFKIGQMIVDSERNTLQMYDSQQSTVCPSKDTPCYVLIERERNKYLCNNYELFCAHIQNEPEIVNFSQEYNGRSIAIRYTDDGNIYLNADQNQLNACDVFFSDERDWYILYDTKKDIYVAVESLNMPVETILQINQMQWNEKITMAIEDTSFFYKIPEMP